MDRPEGADWKDANMALQQIMSDYAPAGPAKVRSETLLNAAHITVNKNAFPNDPEKPFVTSGIRLGSPAMTTRGFGEAEARKVANLIVDLLEAPEDQAVFERVKAEVANLTAAFPVYGD